MCSVEKVFLEISQNSQSIFLNKVAGLHKIKKETLAEVFSCEFCEISKNTTSLTEHLWWLPLTEPLFLQNTSGISFSLESND